MLALPALAFGVCACSAAAAIIVQVVAIRTAFICSSLVGPKSRLLADKRVSTRQMTTNNRLIYGNDDSTTSGRGS